MRSSPPSIKCVKSVNFPQSVSFISGLRKNLLDTSIGMDPKTRKFSHLYVEVALKETSVIMKKVNLKLALQVHIGPRNVPYFKIE